MKYSNSHEISWQSVFHQFFHEFSHEFHCNITCCINLEAFCLLLKCWNQAIFAALLFQTIRQKSFYTKPFPILNVISPIFSQFFQTAKQIEIMIESLKKLKKMVTFRDSNFRFWRVFSILCLKKNEQKQKLCYNAVLKILWTKNK